MKRRKNKELEDYIYIRLMPGMKKRIKEVAALQGSNMTIWVRQSLAYLLNNHKGGV